MTGVEEWLPSTRVSPREDVVVCDLDDGKALLDLRSSRYYKLNHSAAVLWDAMGSGSEIKAICAQMLDRFDVDEEQCFADAFAILDNFKEAGLVEEGMVEDS